jgi:hypothetical protein
LIESIDYSFIRTFLNCHSTIIPGNNGGPQ